MSQPAHCDSDDALAELLEELTGRLQAGEAVDADALAAAHPRQADELRALLPALEALAGAAGQRSSPLSRKAGKGGKEDAAAASATSACCARSAAAAWASSTRPSRSPSTAAWR